MTPDTSQTVENGYTLGLLILGGFIGGLLHYIADHLTLVWTW